MFLTILAISFGELEVSNSTVGILIGITVFTFAAVALSSIKLIQSFLQSEDN